MNKATDNGRDDKLRRDEKMRRDERTTSDDNKSPERLEREVDEARARVGRTASELSDRLSPGELLDQALGMAKEHGGEFGRNLGAQVKHNPMPLILTSVGISWMMMSNKGDAARHYDYETYGDTYGGSDAFGRPDAFSGSDSYSSSDDKSLKDKLGDTAAKSRRRAAAVGDRIHGTSDSMKHSAQNARDSLAEFYRDQPLLAGSLGIAIGAALGAMVPPTAREDELLGHARDRSVDKAKEKASKKYDEVRESARSSDRTRTTGSSSTSTGDRTSGM